MSLHCISGGASFCNCMVTKSKPTILLEVIPKPMMIKTETANYLEKYNWFILPITSHLDRGKTIPELGRTQYFFGFVVFTWKQYKLARRKSIIWIWGFNIIIQIRYWFLFRFKIFANSLFLILLSNQTEHYGVTLLKGRKIMINHRSKL